MTPGPGQIIACPHCDGLASYMTLNSGNTFGATTWTDGKRIAPMLPQPPPVVKCRHCPECYWLEDAKEIGTADLWRWEPDPNAAWGAVEEAQEPSEKEYYVAIRGNLAHDREQEKSLRILTWWRGNDAVRQLKNTAGKIARTHSEEYRSNLVSLADLLDEDDENGPLMKAEIKRELSNFPAAVLLLDRVTEADYASVVSQLRALCQSKDPSVRELRFDN